MKSAKPHTKIAKENTRTSKVFYCPGYKTLIIFGVWMLHRAKLLPGLIAAIIILSGCNLISPPAPIATPTALPPTNTSIPPMPTITPTPTEVPFFVDATVWTGNIQVPILIYHRFIPDYIDNNPTTKIHYSDFRNQLTNLYDNGFSLVPLASWLDGTFIIPTGRKPIILTMDDFWYADQIFINDDGTPSQNSGVGILWQFYKDHPDFGFAVAGFSNMGDKYFADTFVGTQEVFIRNSDDNSPIWRDDLSKAMVWAIENGVMPYNHTYTHVQLDKTSPQDIQYQLSENDRVTRFFLARVNRQDLFSKLGNIIALPFGTWPSTFSGINVLKDYKNPEGLPVAAIMEAYNLDSARLTPSVYSPDFDRFRVQRITASDSMIQFIIDHKDEVPSAKTCKVGPLDETLSSDVETLRSAIAGSISNGSCPEGIYNINGMIFKATAGVVELFKP
jgi:hypothetical protein